MDQSTHLTTEELLLLADGELSRKRAAQASAHVAACGTCRSRLRRLEDTTETVAGLCADDLDSRTRQDGARRLLKTRLNELAAASRPSVWDRFQHFVGGVTLVYAASLVVLAGLGLLALRERDAILFRLAPVQTLSAALPDRSLTPGATRPVSMGDICTMDREQVVRPVSASLQRAVLQKYGLRNARAGDYEIDYLITPGLGGADDISNLWPEPYSATAWNAHVKDALEDRLHQMVCAGKVDLPTAQHDIAANWISAYRKYLHSDKPTGFDARPDRRARADS